MENDKNKHKKKRDEDNKETKMQKKKYIQKTNNPTSNREITIRFITNTTAYESTIKDEGKRGDKDEDKKRSQREEKGRGDENK